MEEIIVQVLWGSVIIFVASMTQGIASFGFSLIALPLLGIFLPLRVVVPILTFYSFVLNTVIISHIRKHVSIKRILIIVITGIVGTPFGAYLLKIASENTLKFAVGVILIIAAIINFKGYKIKVKNEKLVYIPVGLVSGLLNGSVSFAGPPVVLFMSNQGVEKQIFRANLTAYFWILNIVTIPTYFFGGLITPDVTSYSLYLLPSLVIGTLIGIKLGNNVDEILFKRLTLGLITVMGFMSLVSGF